MKSAGLVQTILERRLRLSRHLTIGDMQILAGRRDDQRLSLEYVNAHTHLQWQCAAGHQWLATLGNIRNGKWCPKCRGYMREEERFAFLGRLAQECSGQLLSTAYSGSHESLQWKCSDGHIWMASPALVKGGNSWCLKCRCRYRYNLKYCAQSSGGAGLHRIERLRLQAIMF